MYNDIIQKLADMFFISAEYVQAHFWEYVLMYGKYAFWDNIWGLPIFELLVGIMGAGIGATILMVIDNETTICVDNKLTLKVMLPCVIIPMIVLVFCWVMPYIMSPEMYSLEAVVRLINNG